MKKAMYIMSVVSATMLLLSSCVFNNGVMLEDDTLLIYNVDDFKPEKFNEETFLIVYKYNEEEVVVKKDGEKIINYYYIIHQVNKDGEVLYKYRLENLDIKDATLVQNPFDKKGIYFVDKSEYSRNSNKATDLKLDYTNAGLQHIDSSKNIVAVNKIGEYEVLGYVNEENLLSLLDKARGIVYENVVEFDENEIAVYNNNVIVTNKDSFININQTTGNISRVYTIADIEVNNPKIVTVYDDKLLFFPSKEDTRLYSLNKNFEIEYFCEVADKGFDFDYYKVEVLPNDKIVFNFFKRVKEKELENNVYIVKLEDKKYQKVENKFYDYIEDNTLIDLMYIDYKRSYMYVREIKYIETQNWRNNFKESVLVVDLNTNELVTRLEILEDAVDDVKERVVIAY